LQRIIGLTGGIGTGKTTVSNYLADAYQLPVLDADIYAREAVQLGSPVFNKIVQHYGWDILLEDGTINRQRLGEIVFQNSAERQWLEQQIHPEVRDRFQSELAHLVAPTVVLAIPLLFEAEMTDLVSEIWVVSCRRDQQLRRIIERDREALLLSADRTRHPLSPQQAQSRIDSQLPLVEKMARADVVLDNSSTLEALRQQVDWAIKRVCFNP